MVPEKVHDLKGKPLSAAKSAHSSVWIQGQKSYNAGHFQKFGLCLCEAQRSGNSVTTPIKALDTEQCSEDAPKEEWRNGQR